MLTATINAQMISIAAIIMVRVVATAPFHPKLHRLENHPIAAS
jgi:hypothetical protein